jgi:hypothetical protein
VDELRYTLRLGTIKGFLMEVTTFDRPFPDKVFIQNQDPGLWADTQRS